jgi:ABC-type multidrug transport system ATPase subunit
LNVRDNLIFAGRYFLMEEDALQKRADYLISELELTRYVDFKVDNLSGGNKQRVLIARALMHNPEIVLLDEPTVGLDPDIRRKLWALIRSLKKMNVTVILTTHYLDESEQLSDRICILSKGKVKLLAKLSEMKHKEAGQNLEEFFITLTQHNDSDE